MAYKNSNPYRTPNPASPFSNEKIWDFVRIGYLCFYCGKVLYGTYLSWTQDIASKVVPWHAFFVGSTLMGVAILFASQLQIEKRNLNTSIRQHLGLRRQGIDLEIIGLLTLIYVLIFFKYGIKMKENAKIAKIIKDTKEATGISTATASGAATSTLPKPWWAIWLIGLAVCIIVPITEEMLCRGVIMHEFRARGFSKIYTWLATAILFTIPHGNVGWGGIFPIFFGGLLLGWLRMQTGNLFVPIWLHILNNTRAFITILYHVSHDIDLPNIPFVKTIKYYYLPS